MFSKNISLGWTDLLGSPTGEPGQDPGEEAVLMGGLEGEEVAPQEMVFSLHRLLPNRADTLSPPVRLSALTQYRNTTNGLTSSARKG